jgi:hypothetical protein
MSICPRCQAEFSCCMADQTGKPCWCSAIPPLPLADMPAVARSETQASCYCPTCLQHWKNQRDKNPSGAFQLP